MLSSLALRGGRRVQLSLRRGAAVARTCTRPLAAPGVPPTLAARAVPLAPGCETLAAAQPWQSRRWMGFFDGDAMDKVVDAARSKDAAKTVEAIREGANDETVLFVYEAYMAAVQQGAAHSELTDLEEALTTPQLTEFKTHLRSLLNMETVRLGREGSKDRAARWAPALGSYNAIALGNPGVGKRKSAHILATELKREGILKSAHVIQASGKYLLHLYARQGMIPFIKNARDGVMFIDRFDEMLESQDHSAFHAFINEIEAPGNQPLVCVVSCSMADLPRIRKAFPEFRTNFPLQLELEDLDEQQLADLIVDTAVRRGFKPQSGLRDQLPTIIRESTTSDARTFNMLLAGSMLGKAVQHHAARTHGKHKPSYRSPNSRLTTADFGRQKVVAEANPDGAESVLAQLDPIIGLHSVKEHIRALYASTRIDAERHAAGIGLQSSAASRSLHMVFQGRPGTGKSTVALVIAKLLKEMGLLKHGQLVSAKRNDLVAEYMGQTSHRTMEVVHSAMGGVLLIDEAYTLINNTVGGNMDPYGLEAMNTLLDVLESQRGDLVVILAGYPDEMQDLLDTNPGLRSRFPTVLTFEDYNSSELEEIGLQMLTQEDYVLSDEAKPVFEELAEAVAYNTTGNARSIRNALQQIIMRHSVRVAEVPHTYRSADVLRTIEADDVRGVEVTRNM